MISVFLNVIKFIPKGLIVKILTLCAIFMVGRFTGYQAMKAVEVEKYSKKLVEQIELRKAMEEKVYNLENNLIMARENRRVVYRERIKKVPTYIDMSECTVNDDGMFELQRSLRP